MNEIKRTQENRSGSSLTPSESGFGDKSTLLSANIPPAPLSDRGGSFDNGDPNTTNIYIGNLAPSVTGKIYSRFLIRGKVMN